MNSRGTIETGVVTGARKISLSLGKTTESTDGMTAFGPTTSLVSETKEVRLIAS